MSQVNILITGAGGFTGQALAAALVREAKAASITLTDVVEPAVAELPLGNWSV